jgi:hypothetical protein
MQEKAAPLWIDLVLVHLHQLFKIIQHQEVEVYHLMKLLQPLEHLLLFFTLKAFFLALLSKS